MDKTLLTSWFSESGIFMKLLCTFCTVKYFNISYKTRVTLTTSEASKYIFVYTVLIYCL